MQITKIDVRKATNKKARVYVNGGNNLDLTSKDLPELRVLMAQKADKFGVSKDLLAHAKFSRTAGCSCGCSPGFILETKDIGDVFVEVK